MYFPANANQISVGARPLWLELYRRASARLGNAAEARWLVEEAAGLPWAEATAEPAPARAEAALWAMVGRRLAGEPLQYVLGHWAFRSLDLLVDRRVLIPRPETELVVETALAELDRLEEPGVGAPGGPKIDGPGRGWGPRLGEEPGVGAPGGPKIDGPGRGWGPRLGEEPGVGAPGGPKIVVDLGTGSGAIALSIALERRSVEVWATDSSPGALAVASANLVGLGMSVGGRVRLAVGDWWGALPPELKGRISLAVANPPYVSTAELASLPPEVSEWEPLQALVAGPTGLEAIEALLVDAPRWLVPGAAIVTELAPQHAERAISLAERAGLVEVSVKRDLAGRDRILVGRRE